MGKRIVVGLDPSEYSQRALDLACARAKDTGATLIGVAVVDQPGIELAEAAGAPGSIHYSKKATDYHVNKAKEICKDLVGRFDACCGDQGVACESDIGVGNPAGILVRHTYGADLIVIGMRTFFHFETREKPGDTLLDLLRAQSCPILAVPKDAAIRPRDVLFPYDASNASSRALRFFICLNKDLPLAEEVTLLHVDDDHDRAERLLEQPARLLEAHGYQVNREIVSGDPKQMILKVAKEDPPSLVVLGAYGHGHLDEFLFGSATQSLIEDDTCPLFISA